MKLLRAFALPPVLALILPVTVFAQNVTPEPGEYLTQQGYGTLKVERDSGKGAPFRIDASGANGHSCEIDGAIRNGIATVEAGEKDKPCRVGFKAAAGGIEVTPLTEEECRYFCGARASFDGVYVKPDPACTNAARKQTRSKFRTLYDAKRYQDARDALEPILTTCSKTLNWIEEGSIRNDLAITQYHLHDYNGCLETLKEFDGEQADQQLAGLKQTEPSNGEAYADILTPARHNIALCAKAARQKQ